MRRLFPSMVQSISYSEEEIIHDILELHSPAGIIDLDPTYGKGGIYRGTNLPRPRLRFDLKPRSKQVTQADVTDLPREEGSVGCTLFDPPFIITGMKESSGMTHARFGSFTSWEDLCAMYHRALKELYRITQPQGIVIFKCQDTVNGRYQHFSHVAVMQLACRVGWYPKDLFIFMKKNRPTREYQTQNHARKHHSYFWVFQKSNRTAHYV